MVELGFAAYFRYVDQHRDAFNLFYGIGFAREDEFAGMVEQVSNTLAELVASFIRIEGLGAEQRRLLGHGIVGMIVGTSTHWLRGTTEIDAEAVARQLSDLAWRGLRGVHPAGAAAADETVLRSVDAASAG